MISKKKNIISLILNVIIIISTVYAISLFFTTTPDQGNMQVSGMEFLRFFTNLSNIFVSVAALVMIVFNMGTTLSSYPVGLLGDRFDRKKLLFFGISALLMADIIMFSATTQAIMYLGILFWGIQLGSTQNVFVSLIQTPQSGKKG